MRQFFIYFFGIILLGISGYVSIQSHVIQPLVYGVENLGNMSVTQPAAVIASADAQTNTSLASSTPEKAHILIVPGHEPDYGGAEFHSQYGTIYERNLTVELGQDLQQFLQNDGSYQVDITRDTTSWSPSFADYFKNDWDAIVAWVNASKKSGPSIESLGVAPEIHITDPADVALRLFGIVKWSNENNVDLMIHIHLNDYPGHPDDVTGKYSGLVMYMPDKQYSNSAKTIPIAEAVFKRLSLYNPISDLPIESSGLIADPELIALGANNTSVAASILIEYEYIYQPQLINPAVRSLALKDLAYQTYLGLQDYYTNNPDVSLDDDYNPSTLYTWNGLGTDKDSSATDIYALQTALIMDGDYPPAGKSKNECPHSGTFGACTSGALKAFQVKNNITDESGVVGPKSFTILGDIYSGK